MFPPQDQVQRLVPGRTYKILDKHDIILDTDLYRSYLEGYPKGWQKASYIMPYWVGDTVEAFARGVYKINNTKDYPQCFEFIRDISILIKI